jgi:beta-phosphoglucomutase-like phosphatase (HAD superfamily)
LLDCIVFDLDGVIADTEDLHRQAYNRAFAEAGVRVHWTEADYRARLIQSAGTKLQTVELPSGVTDPVGFRNHLYEKKRLFYLEILRTGNLEPRPGVLRLVTQALEAGIVLGAASTCAKEGALAILNRTLGPFLASSFATIKAGDDVKRRKPFPDVYLLAIESLGFPVERCVAIEDSRHGLESAKAAGLWTLVTPSRYTRGDDFSEADLVVADLERGEIDPERLDAALRGSLQPTKNQG